MANASLAVRVPLAPVAAWFGLFMFSLFSTTTSAQEVEWLRRFGAAGYYDDGGAIATDATGQGATPEALLSFYLDRLSPAPFESQPYTTLLDYLRSGGTWSGSATQLRVKAPGLIHLIVGSSEYQLI